MIQYDVWLHGDDRGYAQFIAARDEEHATEIFAREQCDTFPVRVCVCVDDGPVTICTVEIEETTTYTATRFEAE